MNLNPNLQSLANVFERVCFIAPDATDLRKLTNEVILGSRSIEFLEKCSFVSIEILHFNTLSPTSLFAILMMLLDRRPIEFEKLRQLYIDGFYHVVYEPYNHRMQFQNQGKFM